MRPLQLENPIEHRVYVLDRRYLVVASRNPERRGGLEQIKSNWDEIERESEIGIYGRGLLEKGKKGFHERRKEADRE